VEPKREKFLENKPTVLVVDDDPQIVELMRDFLLAEDYGVESATDGLEALRVMETSPVNCVLLDVMMPNLNGFEVCRQIRETYDIPVLFLSARDEDYDKIRGLGLGADDFIVKSASPLEVVARIKAVMRRYRAPGPTTVARLDFKRFSIDIKAHQVLVAGRPVNFTAREFELLHFMAEHPYQIFTREQLFQRFWGDIGDRHTVTVHIGRIREKIEVDPNSPEYIVTVWGVGYRFEGAKQ
jgi:DNA-binding response OmpR family regulator